MANSDVWLDFEAIRHNIKNNTVDRLKHILSGLNEECGTHYPKSGKKQEIIDRIVAGLDTWRGTSQEEKWMKAKAVVYQVRNTGIYSTSNNNRLPSMSMVPPTPAHTHAPYPHDPAKSSVYSSSVAGSSSIAHYDPYAPPRRPSGILTTIPSSSSSGPKPPAIRFKDSPFFTIDQAVSGVIECPESTSSTDRRQQSLTFTLTPDQSAKLKVAGSKYQLRLFCTSSVFYSGVGSFRTNPVPCLMEFPPTCEVRVNNTQLTANMKGLKKKPGTAPPPDIGKYARTTSVANRVEMVYVNSQQPVLSKKYYMIVMLVETISIETIVRNLRSFNYRSRQDIQQKMVQAMTEDDDIVAGPQKMSLKCPLTFVRITTPCRSSKCVHPQCFDATSWFTMMEQTTTWLCPVCERTLDHKDLIIDGYFDEILNDTTEDVEDVMVEADGQWHTTDNKFGSREWKAAHPVTSQRVAPDKKPSMEDSPVRIASHVESNDVNGKGKVFHQEIFVLDSDDEDEGRVKRELSPSYASSVNQSFEGMLPRPSQSQPSQASQSQVIDLTLDSESGSDDNDEDLVVSNVNGKRKAHDAGVGTTPPSSDQLWKKGRLDPSRILPLPRVSSATHNGVGTSHHSSLPSTRLPSYQSSFQGNTLPLPTATYNYPRSPNLSNGLPPRPFAMRSNDSPPWL